MNRAIIKTIVYFKGMILFLKPHVLFGWLRQPALLLSNTLSISKWIAENDNPDILNDFYTVKREHSKRYKLYQYVAEKFNLTHEPVDYLEFGVCEAGSFKWWLSNSKNDSSRFFGFDTFEGLPEGWGTYKKGEMAAKIPELDDVRSKFLKGLFQDTLPGFLRQTDFDEKKRKVIHLDADLFSSTIFVLTSLAPYLKKGDILFFDEFNVPNHEYFAFKIFTESFYIKTKLLGAVNNYYQAAFIIE